MKRDPYPLQWPDGWKRTKSRGRPQFQAMFARDRDSVIRQLQRRQASNIVITSDLPVRNDGLPYANASCSDPGIAVWWVEKGHERVMACDRWQHITFNLRAVEMSLQAIRGLDRWGASEMVERAFAGFAALPPGNGAEVVPPPPSKRSWREVIGGAWHLPELTPAELLSLARVRHRNAIKQHHPDAGGDPAIAAELNAALDEAERELSR